MGVNLGLCEPNGLIKVDYMQNHRLGLDSTIAHEFIHNLLTESTYYGQFVYLLNVVSKIDHEYSGISKKLEFNMKKVQETTANTIEYLLDYKLNGKSSFEKNLNDLKLENKEYYKYVNQFKFLFKDDRLSIDTKISIVFYMGKEALNINLTNIEQDFFVPNKFEKYVSHQDNTLLYVPNSRFTMVLKELKKYLENNDALDLDEINNIVFSLPPNSIDEIEDKFSNIVEYLKKLTSKSKYANEIHSILSRYRVTERKLESSFNLQITSLNSSYKKLDILHKDFMELDFEIPSVIFCQIVADIEVFQYISENKSFPTLDKMECIYSNLQSKTNYKITDLNLVKILNDQENIKVLDLNSYINIDYSPLKFLKLDTLYVLSYMPYEMIKSNLKPLLNNSYKFRTLDFSEFNAIIASLEENINLILLMDNINYATFLCDLSTGDCKFEEITNFDKNSFDNLIFKNDDDIDIYNNIINTYLQA